MSEDRASSAIGQMQLFCSEHVYLEPLESHLSTLNSITLLSQLLLLVTTQRRLFWIKLDSGLPLKLLSVSRSGIENR